MKICDLHTHILPGADDGAQSLQQSLEMIRNAAASDVAALVVTPHCNVPGKWENYRTAEMNLRFAQLSEAARELPVQLMPGAEVHVTRDLPQLLRQKLLPTLNNSRYMLLEFPGRLEKTVFVPLLRSVLQEGYIPLIAHPERYQAVCREPQLVEQWLDMGCHIQLTGGSVMGSFGAQVKRTAEQLLYRDLVCCIASDAHDPHMRSNFLTHVYDYLTLHYSSRYARILMWENPMRICRDDVL